MTLTPEMVEIAPCPFCGTTDQFVERRDYSSCYVQCDGNARDGMTCGARGPIGVQDSDDEEMPGQAAAIRAWNARAQSHRAAGWMPIDTAPKDEATHYLVRIPGNDICDALVLQVSNFEGGIYADCRDGLIDWTDRITTATHWMPIALIERAGGGE